MGWLGQTRVLSDPLLGFIVFFVFGFEIYNEKEEEEVEEEMRTERNEECDNSMAGF